MNINARRQIMKLVNRFIRLIFIGFLAFVTVKISTFGWNFFTPIVNIRLLNLQLADNLKSHVYKLSAEIGDRSVFKYGKLEQSADYITNQLKTIGYDVEFQKYTIEGKNVRNIIASKPGERFPQEIIIVGAHYDTCFNPGADDNASGVSGLLELARLLKDKTTDRTIEFVFFVNEEPPFFKSEYMGSRVFAREAKKERKNIKAVIVFEMIGCYSNKINSQRYLPIAGIFFPNKGNFIGVFGNFRSRQLVDRIKKSFKHNSSFPIESLALDFIPGIDFSDHWSFWKEGYPAVMISDTAFLRHNNYHKNSDTWEKINFENMACIIEGFYQVLSELTK